MVDAGLGLVGFSHAYALATLGEMLGVYLLVFVWKKRHLQPIQWWHGLDCKAAAKFSLNKRFVAFTIPNVLQMGADLASSTIWYGLMSKYGPAHVAAFGVADVLRNTGGSVSLGLYTVRPESTYTRRQPL